MNEELSFKRHVHFEGRNGYFKSIGLRFEKDNILNNFPITSKVITTRCLIEITIKEIKNGNTL